MSTLMSSGVAKGFPPKPETAARSIELSSLPDGGTSDVLPVPRQTSRRKSLYDRIEAFVSGLSVRDNFWHRICAFIWLPYAFFSGIRMKRMHAETFSDPKSFSAILPFTRRNRNWYRAMAGAALLGNSEIAGGMYVFGVVGADYTVVCKHLEYSFLRPCLGPAVYKMHPREDISALRTAGGEFNVTLDLDILQQITPTGERDRRVGKCVVTFHVTPKIHHKAKIERRQA